MVGKIQTILDMTLGEQLTTSNNEATVIPPILEAVDEAEDGLMEIAAKKNRQIFAINKSYSIENGYKSSNRNLVDDAKFETKVNEENKKNWIQLVRQQTEELADEELVEDDVFIIESIAGQNQDEKLRVTMIISLLKDSMAGLNKILKIVEANNGSIAHMETRDSMNSTGQDQVTKMDVLLKVDIKHVSLIHLIKTLRRSSYLSDVHLLSSQSINLKCKIKGTLCISHSEYIIFDYSCMVS